MYQDFPPDDLLSLGARATDLDRLLAIILDTPPSAEDLHEVRRALRLNGPARTAALHSVDGGPRLMAALEVGRRALTAPLDHRDVAGTQSVMVQAALALTDEHPDDVVVLYLHQTPEGPLTLVGRAHTPMPRIRTVISGAMRRAATHIVLLQRGPLEPPSDAFVTLALATAAGAMATDLVLHDALAIDRREGFCSLRERGLIP